MSNLKPGSHRYPAILRCIYCRDSDIRNLTDEHIFPYSLGGNLVLEKSSCRECANITKKYEQTVARDVFGKFRVRHNIQTRRKKERPQSYPIDINNPDGTSSTIDIPAKSHPSPLFLYKFAPANILHGLSREIDTFLWIIYCAATSDAIELIETHKWDGKLKIRPVPIEFARMLAKIAHSHAVAMLGTEAFHPLALDIILCRTDNVSYLVGGNYAAPTSSTDDLEAPVRGAGHLFSLRYVSGPHQELFLLGEIRLFASLSSPTYHVIVGKVENQNHHDIFETQRLLAASTSASV